MCKISEFIAEELVETDYGRSFGGVREPSLEQLLALRRMVDEALDERAGFISDGEVG